MLCLLDRKSWMPSGGIPLPFQGLLLQHSLEKKVTGECINGDFKQRSKYTYQIHM